MTVALRAVRRRNPARLVLAVPVAPPETLVKFCEEADEVICLERPVMLGAIGFHYRDFHQMSDEEVTDLLARAAQLTSEATDLSDRHSRCGVLGRPNSPKRHMR
jgi:putative phosphoribosyl transferase